MEGLAGSPLDDVGEQVIVGVPVGPSLAGPELEMFDLGDGLPEGLLSDAIFGLEALFEQNVLGFGNAAGVMHQLCERHLVCPSW